MTQPRRLDPVELGYRVFRSVNRAYVNLAESYCGARRDGLAKYLGAAITRLRNLVTLASSYGIRPTVIFYASRAGRALRDSDRATLDAINAFVLGRGRGAGRLPDPEGYSYLAAVAGIHRFLTETRLLRQSRLSGIDDILARVARAAEDRRLEKYRLLFIDSFIVAARLADALYEPFTREDSCCSKAVEVLSEFQERDC